MCTMYSRPLYFIKQKPLFNEQFWPLLFTKGTGFFMFFPVNDPVNLYGAGTLLSLQCRPIRFVQRTLPQCRTRRPLHFVQCGPRPDTIEVPSFF
jgi:hypothetical protein